MRLVDADTLSKETGKLWEQMPDGEELSKELMKAINHAPTVDAVPVVRCEKCKYSCREIFSNGSELYLCTRIGKDSFILLNEGDKYCAFGERRENDEH